MKQLFAELFIWWHGQTFATRLYTYLFGVFVGKDDAGNRYYRGRRGGKRWVLYAGAAEPSHEPQCNMRCGWFTSATSSCGSGARPAP